MANIPTDGYNEMWKKILDDQDKIFGNMAFGGIDWAKEGSDKTNFATWMKEDFTTSTFTSAHTETKKFPMSSLSELAQYLLSNPDVSVFTDKQLFYDWLLSSGVQTAISGFVQATFAGVPVVVTKTKLMFWRSCPKCGSKHLPFAVDDTIICFSCGEEIK